VVRCGCGSGAIYVAIHTQFANLLTRRWRLPMKGRRPRWPAAARKFRRALCRCYRYERVRECGGHGDLTRCYPKLSSRASLQDMAGADTSPLLDVLVADLSRYGGPVPQSDVDHRYLHRVRPWAASAATRRLDGRADVAATCISLPDCPDPGRTAA
jgi:hypothetical protein